ncbi:type II toxin-antitoxin system HicA family toxin [Methanosarcina siciliae]|uniref:type II toxin-antitoxin system HicA family toxin n=1 Tax=Methanosarcina siciliae TaxID=38027 RepID=UPI000B2D8755|nr:type II toxin-antitoxin system HicA family toxin [Methanosarcina siciliae]
MKMPLIQEEMCKIAFKLGFEMVRQRGSHRMATLQRKYDNNTPVYPGKNLPRV